MNDELISTLLNAAQPSSDARQERAAACPHGPRPSQPEWRSVFISDVHIGTKDCKASALNQFLKHHPCEHLYLVGDVLDGWKMKKGIYWKPAFSRVIKRIFKLSKSGVNITYITGNHDEFLRKYANNRFDNIQLVNKTVHITATNQRLLVIHGDQFEGVTHCSGILRYIGDNGYELLMFLNRQFNRLRARFGHGYWSFSGFLKKHIQRAQRYINDYENAVAYGAKKQGYDGVICGHIHHANQREIAGVNYYNTGDWVESCTALVEDHDGNLKLINWLEDPRYITHKKNKKQRKSYNPKSYTHPMPVPVPEHDLQRKAVVEAANS
ncbi:MAG TPA: UDP-2,3-diacylglucosamine diphosphatase [Marinagarivorans sp.]